MSVINKALVVVMSTGVALGAAVVFLYLGNRAPVVPPVLAADPARTAKPYVVKLHAQWCPLCMITKDVWREIETTYAGRVNLVVLDFTNDANTSVSRAEAKRLGLEQLFSNYEGATGVVVVLDAQTGDVLASIKGSRDFGEYRAAIDSALERVKPSRPGFSR